MTACGVCKKEFKTRKIGHGKIQKFCSLPCAWKGQNNGRKGADNPKWRGGLPHCLNCNKQISYGTMRCKSCAATGILSHNWKGGKGASHIRLRKTSRYQEWRKAIFERDNYTCIWCGDNRGGNLQADHIKPFAYFPKLRFVINNGRTLCKSCHKNTETWGWKAYNYFILQKQIIQSNLYKQ